MRRILFGLALFGLVGAFMVPSEATAAQFRSARTTHLAGKSHATHRAHKTRHVNKAAPATKTTAVHKSRSVSKAHSGSTVHHVSNSGPVRRYFGTRLYYSNAFRGMIPGTGYGGFRRPAFGNRGY